MNRKKLTIILFVFNSTVAFCILADCFLFPQESSTVRIVNKAIEQAFDYHRRGHQNFFIIDSGGHKYNVSETCYFSLDTGSHFILYKSYLFKKATGVAYSFKEKLVHDDIGTVKASLFGTTVCVVTLLFSLLCLFFLPAFKNKALPLRVSLLLFWITVVIILFYFVFQA